MAKKLMQWKTKGMNRDLSVSAFNPEFSFENMNLRLSTNEGNTLLSWVNEKGTEEIPVTITWESSSETVTYTSVKGTVIGVAVLNKYLVLFCAANDDFKVDSICRLEYTDNTKTAMEGVILYTGMLNFSTDYPIETQVSYESEFVQKVYWTDGRYNESTGVYNSPRCINIKRIYGNYDENETYNPFDFVPELQLNETVTVLKMLGANGMFAPGTIQYALTYYNKYGPESNIFYTTPLQYISYADRGANPEDKVANAFKITVTGIDNHFEYLRIYSIQRTSIDGTPICKRVQDIEIGSLTTITYIDTGMSGDSIDPTELLYKGGESVTVETMGQKDNTLFMGNIQISRPYIDSSVNVKEGVYIQSENCYRQIYVLPSISGNYVYSNQLTSYTDSNKEETVPCGGFKYGDYYRLGVQFQYKTGKWSDPIWIKDDYIQKTPEVSDYNVYLPRFMGKLSVEIADSLVEKGYRKIRPVVVFPSIQDRVTICQGVINPTLYTKRGRDTDNNLHGQSDWFFRPPQEKKEEQKESPTDDKGNAIRPKGCVFALDTRENYFVDDGSLVYTDRHCGNSIPEDGDAYNPMNITSYIKQVEVQGDYDPDNKFQINPNFLTLHSPDVEFNDEVSVMDFNNLKYKIIGYTEIAKTFSDIDIQTETPPISNSGGGFVHKSFVKDGMYGIVSGLFYDDYAVDDSDNSANAIFQKYNKEHSPYKWMVYLWNKSGSLNNDINRPSDKGVQSAKLKKKVISNLRFADSTIINIEKNKEGEDVTYDFNKMPQLFNSEEDSIIKIGTYIYKGNINTIIMPDHGDGQYFAFGGSASGYPASYSESNIQTDFSSLVTWKTFSKNEDASNSNGLWQYDKDNTVWKLNNGAIGDGYVDLTIKKEGVRMKYKSTPHLVFETINIIPWEKNTLPVLDIIKKDFDTNTIFGGQSADALRENVWVPCGKPVRLDELNDLKTYVVFYYDYGDTYFQRYDCLKTYPFSSEDVNQVVEIGSFMLETHVNIDGRYDRNRGQLSNLNMTPRNFNLINMVYSQKDNFFSYRIQDDSYYENSRYPNQITWSKTKTSGADTDAWTNVTLASTMELDGDKGEITKLARLNDQLLCFQDTGISQILYNENVQVASTTGVPIEIANSEKVQGKRYLSNTIGCSNKWSLVNTPAGIYFMDSNDKSIYRLGGSGLENISQQGGFNAWCKQNIPAGSIDWVPGFSNVDSNGHAPFVACYDKLNQDVLFVNNETALAYSEKLGAFTSFYDYEGSPFFCSLDDTGIWVRPSEDSEGTVALWKHQAGDYCQFFGENKPYWMTLVGNPEPTTDKIFTNLEFRACVEDDGELNQTTGKFTPTLPFDSLEAWNEYQHGYTALENKSGHNLFQHGGDSSALIRKFRIWRHDIPRNNCLLDGSREEGVTYAYSKDSDLGVSRHIRKVQDRMRNPWLYLKLYKGKAEDDEVLPKAEIHDLIMAYYN